ncbi:hypothetical protein [Streptomyces sp. NPDC001286]
MYFADVRGSMPDLVQAVGRALRMQPGEGKMASLVVPVLLRRPGRRRTTCSPAGRSAGWRCCWRRSGRTTPASSNQLTQQQAPSRYKPVQKDAKGKEKSGGGDGGPSASAKALLTSAECRPWAAACRPGSCGCRGPS